MVSYQLLGMLIRTSNIIENILYTDFEGIHDLKSLKKILLFLLAFKHFFVLNS